VKNRWRIVLLFLVVGIGLCLQAGQKQALLEKKKQLEEEIQLASRLLEQTRTKRNVSVEELRLLQSRINKRDQLVIGYKSDMDKLDKEIQRRLSRINSYKKDLEKAKTEYASLIYYAFKNQNRNLELMYLLASDDINQMYERFKYLEQYKEYRLKTIELIKKLTQIIEVEVIELTQRREEKAKLLNAVLVEKATLVEDKGKVSNVVKQLKANEKEIEKEIAAKRKLTEKLDKEIEEIIKKESTKKNYGNLTPGEKIISDDFKSNKGRLPWPTEQGLVTDKFGEHPHPAIKDLMIRNNGIDITTVANASARVVFNGTVSKVFSIKGANSTVIVRHGNFYSVYHNLKEVSVRAGDEVKTKQLLGKIFTDPASGNTILHFEVWEEMNKKNPEEWLSN